MRMVMRLALLVCHPLWGCANYVVVASAEKIPSYRPRKAMNLFQGVAVTVTTWQEVALVALNVIQVLVLAYLAGERRHNGKHELNRLEASAHVHNRRCKPKHR